MTSAEVYDTTLTIPKGIEMLAAAGDLVEANQVIAREKGANPKDKDRDTSADVVGPVRGFLVKGSDGLVLRAEDIVEREYTIPHNAKILVENGQEIRAGDVITDGPINPQEYLDTRGKDAVQRYLVKEVQKVYRSQGVTINDKHIETIVRQMLRKVRIDEPGDIDLLPTELIDPLEFEEANNRVRPGGEPATAQTVLLGVTKASLDTSSFLAAASFQETTRVLTEAAIDGVKDRLIGLKENVIIGKLIPAGTARRPTSPPARSAIAGPLLRRSPARRSRRGLAPSTTRSSRRAGSWPTHEAAGLALAATIAGGDGDNDGEDMMNFSPFLTQGSGDATETDDPEAAAAALAGEPEERARQAKLGACLATGARCGAPVRDASKARPWRDARSEGRAPSRVGERHPARCSP